jgi:predicted GIY-YIG superfamily endonuclease
MKNEYYVYCYLDEYKNTLYVGITNNMHSRNGNHKRKQHWYEEVNEIIYYTFSDETTQRMVEIYLINERKAKYNNVHNYEETPSIKIELPKFENYQPNLIKTKISKNNKFSKIPNKTSKIKINYFKDAIKLNREIRFEDIMLGNKKILFNEFRSIELKFGDYNTKKDYNEIDLKSFYYESEKFEDEKNFYIVLKDKKQIEIFKDSYLCLDFGSKSGRSGGLGLLSSFYEPKKETLSFTFNKEILEDYVSEYIPDVSYFFSNLMKCEKKEISFSKF